jgi:hypothetical protein
MSQLPLDDRDAVLAWKPPPEFVGDHLAANAAAPESESSSPSPQLLPPLEHERAIRPLHPVGQPVERTPMRRVG